MSHRALGAQFTEKVATAVDAAATFGRMLTVGHVNYRDLVLRERDPVLKAAADAGYRRMGRT